MINWIEFPYPMDYSNILTYMENIVELVINNKANESVLILEHQDIYSAGTSAQQEELLNPGNIPVYYTGRGGKFTYHGPGQLILYPILNLSNQARIQDIKKYIYDLELLIINFLKNFNINGFLIPDKIGVWVKVGNKEQKIAAIGIRVRKWVTYHGIAINISTNLDNFSKIMPCGMDASTVTSLQALGIKSKISDCKTILKYEFNKIFTI